MDLDVARTRGAVHRWSDAPGARRLTAQAAKAILAAGRVPLSLHAHDNHASAKAAEAAGFPDRGWRYVERHA